ncbi:MAG TPA: Ig-like domain-containing protein, partial [Casimicrobiaceae bacterium]
MNANRHGAMIMNVRRIVALAVVIIGTAIGVADFGGITRAAAAVREPGTTEIALTNRGDSWWVSATIIERRSPTGELVASMRSDASGLGTIERFAISPHDASLWVVTDAHRLVHVESDGVGASASPLPPQIASLAVAQNGDVWVALPDAIVHFAADGRPLASHPLGTGDAGRAMPRDSLPKRSDAGDDPGWRQVLVDSLRDQAWIVGSRRLARFDLKTLTEEPSLQFAADCEARDAALDALTGNVFVLCDQALRMFDAVGTEASKLSLDDASSEAFDRLVHDPQSGDLIASRTGVALRVGTVGGLELRGSVDPALATVRPAPFRIDPTVALLRPPDGGATWDEGQELVLALGAQCPSTACAIPQSYIGDLELEIAINGVREVSPQIDPVARRAVLRAGTVLHPGVNRIEAEVHDRFGHVGRMPTASLALLTASVQSGSTDRMLVTKAANKPPTATLTAPLAGSTFTTGSDITVSASASDSDGSIARVDFYRNGSTLIGTATTSPYTIAWSKVVAGSHSLTARAFDNRNGSTTSAPVVVNVVDNQSPTVIITNPADGAFYAAGSPITLTADARDGDGSIARLEFLDRATTIAVLGAAPWTWTWSDAAPGPHALTARATDDRGAVTTSGAVNMIIGAPPRVVVAAPAPCTVADAPIDFLVTVDVYSASSAIASVEVFDGSTSVGAVLQPPWRFVIANAGAGTHSITARATDAHGLSATSRPAIVEVRAANQPPTASVTAPSEGATFASGATVTLRANASDPDGNVASVLFHTESGFAIGTVTQAPYQVDWKSLTPGNYTVYARVVDDRDAVTTSAPVHFTVAANRPPTVSLTAPADGATFGAPATIGLAANAGDPDGAIARVEFYSGTTLLGTDTSEPFTYDWSGVGAGTYSLTARAYDNSGAMAETPAVSVIVAANAQPTVTLTAPAAGADYYAPATVSLAATASDPDGSVARVEFRADGLLVGTAATAPYAITWANVPAGTYSITATAYDGNGGQTTTSPLSLVVKAPVSLSLVDLAEGATIDDDRMHIRGYFWGPDNSSITINGTVAHVDDLGLFHVNDLPLAPGVNTIDAVVTTQDGQSASRSSTVNSTGPGAFVVNASPTEGIDSLEVTFTTESRGGATFKQIFFDLDGDGYPNVIATPAQFADGPFSFAVTYPVGTWNVAI